MPSSYVAIDATIAILVGLSSRAIQSLLPRVHNIHWSAIQPHTIMFLSPFVSPSTLRTLKLDFPKSGGQSAKQLLYSLTTVRLTHLRSFSLTTRDEDSVFQDALATFLEPYHSLTSLELRGITPSQEVRRRIASMAELRTALLFFAYTQGDDLRSKLSVVENWPSLETLQIQLEDSTASLSIIPFDAITPLLNLHLLSRLKIDCRIPRDIKGPGKDIPKMAEAWPHMLELEITPRTVELTAANLVDLTDFADAFSPSLETLKVSFGYDENDVLTETESITKKFTCLRHLDIGYPGITEDQVDSAAEYLAVLCPPGLEMTLEDCKVAEDSITSLWRKVDGRVRAHHRVHVQRSI